MKRQNTVIYICVIITLLNVAGLLFIACKSNSPIATASTPVQSSTSGYYSDAYMPEALTFAGETVPLQRLDVQEALRKELIVNSYLHSHTIQILQTAPRYPGRFQIPGGHRKPSEPSGPITCRSSRSMAVSERYRKGKRFGNQ
mgnify:CR=1 FL=1